MDTSSSEEQLTPDELETWAKKHGYDMGRRKRARRNIFQSLGEIGRKPITPQPRKPDPSKGSLDLDLSKMTIKKALKGDHDKKVCLIEVSGKDYVLKGAEGTPKDHIEASRFIGQLGLKGVKVPQVRLLDDGEKSELIKTLSQGDKDSQDLSTSLQKGSGQLSQMVEGKPLEQLYLSREESSGRQEVIKLRELVDKGAMDPETAWQTVLAPLVKSVIGASLTSKSVVEGWPKVTDPGERKKILDWCQTALNRPRPLELVKFLSEIHSGSDLKKGLETARSELEERQKAMAPLKNFAGSPEGIEAFAGVAVSDLLTGMDDRMLTKWNGGNFLFDEKSQSLCCIDNVKDVDRGPGAKDESSWLQFFRDNTDGDMPLENVLYDKLYGDGRVDEQSPGGFVELDDDQQAGAKEIFRKVLQDVVAKMESDPSPNPVISGRAAYLKARLIVDEAARVPTHLATPPALPPKLDVGEKISRGLGSLFTSNKKDKRKDTKKIKDDLRSGKITAADARKQLDTLEQGSNTLGNDRRAGKIRFLAGLTELLELLDERSAALAKAAGEAPPEIWSTLGPRTAALRQAVADWQAAAVKESKLLPQLNQAWSRMPDAVKSGA